MACVKILILFGLLSLGFLIPSSEVAATARDIGTKSSNEDVTNPIITMVVDDILNYLNLSDARTSLSLTFDLENEDYLEFIKLMRDMLRNNETHGIPVLLPQQPETPENARWLDIDFVVGENRITVRLEQSNLYVRGYRRTSAGERERFWELNDTRLIPDRQDNLRFSGSYSGSNSMGSLAGGREVPLGYSPLENAIRTLVRLDPSTGGNDRDIARSLLVIVQMFAEGPRFRTISDHIGENYWAGVTLDRRMLAMQNGWGQLSTAVMQIGENPTPETNLPNIPANNPTQVSTFGQALAALGILIITRPRGGSRSAPDYGRCLMNLEYVRVNHIESTEHRANHVFGAVTVDDGWYTYDFYRRQKNESERVPPGAFATLTDSDHSFPVSGMDAFTVNVALFEGDRFSSSDEIAEGYVLWDRLVESVTFANYDKHLQRVVKGSHGDVTVGYSVLSYALGVTVEVILLAPDRDNPSEVYGTLTASQVLGGSAGLAPITLLDVSSGERVSVRRLQSIPLTRKVFAAAATTKLTVTADLWDHDYLSLDENIAKGSADFTVQPGKQSLNIAGRYGDVQVVVTCA